MMLASHLNLVYIFPSFNFPDINLESIDNSKEEKKFLHLFVLSASAIQDNHTYR